MADVYRKGPTRSPVLVLVYNPMQKARSHRHAVGSGARVFQLQLSSFCETALKCETTCLPDGSYAIAS